MVNYKRCCVSSSSSSPPLLENSAHGTAAASDLPPLVATSTSNIGKLAGAITFRIREREGVSTISAIGPLSSYNALKAVVIANKYLHEGGETGQSLSVMPSKGPTSVAKAGFPETVGLLLRVCSVRDPGEAMQPEIFAKATTNVGRMAALVVRSLQRGVPVTAGAIGPQACSSVLKASIIAQRYMQDSPGQAGAGAIVLVPRMDHYKEMGETCTRMLFICLLAGAQEVRSAPTKSS